jgi:ribosomal protein L11 methyltransferase
VTHDPVSDSPSTDDKPAAWALVTDATLEEANVHLPRLQQAGLLGAVEQQGRCWLYFPQRVSELPIEGTWEPVADVDWSQAWRENLEPVTVGEVTVAPPWLAEPDARTVVIEPAQAFGTGHHETTAACLAALQELDLTHRRVLDAGTGSGILAIAAARLGAAEVAGCDVDPVAVDAARANAAANGVEVHLLEGDVPVVGDRAFDVVVANLDTSALTWAAPHLVRRLAAGGTLIAAGISHDRRAEALQALAHAGLAAIDRPGDEWAVLIGRR